MRNGSCRGERRAIFEEHDDHGTKTQVFRVEQVSPGKMSAVQYEWQLAIW